MSAGVRVLVTPANTVVADKVQRHPKRPKPNPADAGVLLTASDPSGSPPISERTSENRPRGQDMTKVQMMKQALQELGEATPMELAAFLNRRYGVRIEPRFIPVLRASVLQQDMLENFRQRVRAAGAGAAPAVAPAG